MHEFEHPTYARLERAAIDAFVDGEAPSQRALAIRMARGTSEDPHRIAQTLPHFLKRLEQAGCYASQPARFGSKSGRGALTSPYIFNYTGRPAAAATLRVALEAYLASNEITRDAKKDARTALRFLLELATVCDDETLLRAAETVKADSILGLPEAVYRRGTDAPAQLKEKTAKNYRSAIRRLIEFGATMRFIPMVFPRTAPDDLWVLARDRWFPMAETGATSASIATARSAMNAMGKVADDVLERSGTDPSALTREEAEKIIKHIQTKCGKRATGYNARVALKGVAATLAEGPYALPHASDAFDVRTADGSSRPALYLRGSAGEAGDRDWMALLDVLRHNGVPEATIEFLLWYRCFVTLPAFEILARDREFPIRRERTRISQRTLCERGPAIRGFFGVAIQSLTVDGEQYGLSLPPSTLTPDVVFGRMFKPILLAMVCWWQARAATLPPGTPRKGVTGALRQMVINLGMLAQARYEFLRHQQGLKVSSTITESGMERLDWRAEEDTRKTAEELAAWNAYRDAGRLADALLGVQSKGTKARRKRTNEFRKIKRMLERTPPSYWIALLDELLRRFRELANKGLTETYDYQATTLNAVVLGILISTGCRIDEICHIRLDVQLGPANLALRRIVLREIDRKNSTAHTVLLQPTFLPDDLLEAYLTQVRPALIAKWAAREGRPNHPFLIMSTAGTPYGCLEEAKDGSDRDEAAFASRVNQCATRVQAQLSGVAIDLGLELPDTLYEFGPHVIRGVCGYAMYLLGGASAAAHYLGDTEATAMDHYSAVNGIFVDSTRLVGAYTGPKLHGAPASSGGQQDEVTQMLESLLEAARAGRIAPADAAHVKELVSAIGRRRSLHVRSA